MEPVPQLQHSNKFVEEEYATIVRQAPVIKGDFKITGGSAHVAFYFTKSEVKGKIKNVRKVPVFIGENPSRLGVFTPDPGATQRFWTDSPVAIALRKCS